jgi:hypothetical protein
MQLKQNSLRLLNGLQTGLTEREITNNNDVQVLEVEHSGILQNIQIIW